MARSMFRTGSMSLGHWSPLPLARGEIRVGLARRRCVDHIKFGDPGRLKRQNISLLELEGVTGLRGNVHADYVEPRPVVARRSAASAAEQIEQAWSSFPHP